MHCVTTQLVQVPDECVPLRVGRARCGWSHRCRLLRRLQHDRPAARRVHISAVPVEHPAVPQRDRLAPGPAGLSLLAVPLLAHQQASAHAVGRAQAVRSPIHDALATRVSVALASHSHSLLALCSVCCCCSSLPRA